MRTVAGIMLALLASSASPGVASGVASGGLPDRPRDLVVMFATCAGRMSALMEHQRLFDGPASDATALLRDAFADLTGAVAEDLPDLPRHQPMAWRVEAKAAAAGLLTQAAFGPHARRTQAARLAEARMSECLALIPGA